MPSKLLKCTWSIHWWLRGKLSSVVPTRDVYGCNQAEMSSWGAAERDTLERIEGFMICSCKPAVEENKLRSRKFWSLMVCECVCACLRVSASACVCVRVCVWQREGERRLFVWMTVVYESRFLDSQPAIISLRADEAKTRRNISQGINWNHLLTTEDSQGFLILYLNKFQKEAAIRKQKVWLQQIHQLQGNA